jgi:hypothetical protein
LVLHSPHDGIEWIVVGLIDFEWIGVRLMRIVVVVEEICDWEESVIISESSRRTVVARVMWDGHDSADRSCTAIMTIPGAVGHYFCKAVRGDLIQGDLVVGCTGSCSNCRRMHRGTNIVVVGSRRARSSC